MIRFTLIQSAPVPAEQALIDQIPPILAHHFPYIAAERLTYLTDQLSATDGLLTTHLLIAHEEDGSVRGFAAVACLPDHRAAYLEFLACLPGGEGQGLGGQLYQQVRTLAKALGAVDLWFEVTDDSPKFAYGDVGALAQNRARLRFYERHGARMVTGIGYNEPCAADDDGSSALMLDILDGRGPPSGARARAVVGAVLKREFPEYCSDEYIAKVVASIPEQGALRTRLPAYGAPLLPFERPPQTPPRTARFSFG